MAAPEIIEKLQRDLDTLMEKDNLPYVTVEDAAKLIGADSSCLRNSIYKGVCPFGVGYPGDKLHNGYSKIPKLAFYRWMTTGKML